MANSNYSSFHIVCKLSHLSHFETHLNFNRMSIYCFKNTSVSILSMGNLKQEFVMIIDGFFADLFQVAYSALELCQSGALKHDSFQFRTTLKVV